MRAKKEGRCCSNGNCENEERRTRFCSRDLTEAAVISYSNLERSIPTLFVAFDLSMRCICTTRRFRDSETKKLKNSKIKGSKNLETEKFEDSKIQKFKNSET